MLFFLAFLLLTTFAYKALKQKWLEALLDGANLLILCSHSCIAHFQFKYILCNVPFIQYTSYTRFLYSLKCLATFTIIFKVILKYQHFGWEVLFLKVLVRLLNLQVYTHRHLNSTSFYFLIFLGTSKLFGWMRFYFNFIENINHFWVLNIFYMYWQYNSLCLSVLVLDGNLNKKYNFSKCC